MISISTARCHFTSTHVPGTQLPVRTHAYPVCRLYIHYMSRPLCLFNCPYKFRFEWSSYLMCGVHRQPSRQCNTFSQRYIIVAGLNSAHLMKLPSCGTINQAKSCHHHHHLWWSHATAARVDTTGVFEAQNDQFGTHKTWCVWCAQEEDCFSRNPEDKVYIHI